MSVWGPSRVPCAQLLLLPPGGSLPALWEPAPPQRLPRAARCSWLGALRAASVARACCGRTLGSGSLLTSSFLTNWAGWRFADCAPTPWSIAPHPRLGLPGAAGRGLAWLGEGRWPMARWLGVSHPTAPSLEANGLCSPQSAQSRGRWPGGRGAGGRLAGGAGSHSSARATPSASASPYPSAPPAEWTPWSSCRGDLQGEQPWA